MEKFMSFFVRLKKMIVFIAIKINSFSMPKKNAETVMK